MRVAVFASLVATCAAVVMSPVGAAAQPRCGVSRILANIQQPRQESWQYRFDLRNGGFEARHPGGGSMQGDLSFSCPGDTILLTMHNVVDGRDRRLPNQTCQVAVLGNGSIQGACSYGQQFVGWER